MLYIYLLNALLVEFTNGCSQRSWCLFLSGPTYVQDCQTEQNFDLNVWIM